MAVPLPPTRPKEQTFRSNLKNFWNLCGLAVPLTAWLVYIGVDYLRYSPPQVEDPLRLVAGYLPLVVAVLCAVGLAVLYVKNANRRIEVSPAHFTYEAGRGEPLQIRWEDTIFYGPRPDQKPLFPMAIVSDGPRSIRFEKFFFSEFDVICAVITSARQAVRNEGLVIN